MAQNMFFYGNNILSWKTFRKAEESAKVYMIPFFSVSEWNR